MVSQSMHIIFYNKKVRDALEQISLLSTNPLILFVVDEKGKLLGSLTDGDIRKGLLLGITLDDDVTVLMNKDFKYLQNPDDYERFNALRQLNLKIIPLLDDKFQIVDLLDFQKIKAILPVDAVIMAGGKGVRLKPYTDDTPKPMLKVGDKPIIAHNIDRLIEYGIKNIYISVNYLKDQLINFITETYSDCLNIDFIEENQPLGTIGSVRLASSFKHDDILVMNSDILTNIDFFDFYKSYKETEAKMSVSTFGVRINLPYGILNTEGETVQSLVEKPSFTYYSNAGIYLINKAMLTYIPENKAYDATDLLECLIENKQKVSHFLIRGYWLDIGNMQNYAKAQEDIKFIKF